MIAKSNRVSRATRLLDRACVIGSSNGIRVWMEELETRRLFSGAVALETSPSTDPIAAIDVPAHQPGDGLPITPPANDPHHLNNDPNVVYIQWRGSGMYVARGEWMIQIDGSTATWMTPPDMNQSDWSGGDLYRTDRGMQAALDTLGAGIQFKEYLGVWKMAAITVPDGVSFDQLQQTLSKLPGFTGEVEPDGMMWTDDPPASVITMPFDPLPQARAIDPSRVYLETLTDGISQTYDMAGPDLVIYHLSGPTAPKAPSGMAHQLTTINWGDGTVTHEYVSLLDNTIYLESRHKFPSDGTYNMTITLDTDGRAIALTATVQRERDDVEIVDMPSISINPANAASEPTQLMTFRGDPSDVAGYFAWLDVPATQTGHLIQVKPVEGSPGEYAVYGDLSWLDAGDYDITITLSRGIDISKVVGGDLYFADNQLLAIVHGDVLIGNTDEPLVSPSPSKPVDPKPVDPTAADSPAVDPTATDPTPAPQPVPAAPLPSAPAATSLAFTGGSRALDSLLDLKDDAIFPAIEANPIIS